MAPVLGLLDVYHVFAALFQLTLAWLIVRVGRADDLRNGFALVLSLSGLETTVVLLQNVGPLAGLQVYPLMLAVDSVLLWTLVFLATQLPRPIGGRIGARRARRIWLGGIALIFPLALAVAIPHARSPAAGSLNLPGFVHEPPFLLLAAVLALWSVPRWQALPPGPLRGQAWLAIAGAGVSTFFQQGVWLTRFLTEPWAHALTCGGRDLICLASVIPATTWFGLAAVALLVHARVRSGSSDAGFLALSLVFAMGLGVWFHLAPGSAGAEVAAQVLRPMLVAAAMLRYDLFQVSTTARRVLLPTAGIFLAVLLFLLTGLLLEPDGFAATHLGPWSALTGLLVAVGATVGLQGSLTAVAGPADRQGGRLERLDRYRLALERAGAEATGPDATGELRVLRDELGITREEHDVLTTILSHHLLVPTRAVAGLEPGMQVAHRYTVRKELGRGGFGRALLATDEETGEEVVLKELLRPWEDAGRDRGRASLEREAALADLDLGEHVAQVHTIVEAGYTTYLVREHVPGRPLDEVLETEGRMPPHRAVDLVDGILAGVQALHDHGLLHLDLKPANIILTPAGRPVLIDVGQSDRQDQEVDLRATATLVSASSRMGTLAWMAPEQVLGQPVDERTDLFAVGALLHRSLTGVHHVRLEGASAYEIEDAIVRGSPPRLGDQAPAPLGHVIEQALARDPQARFQGAQAFRDALSGPAREASPGSRPR